jgi:hypothetical protein
VTLHDKIVPLRQRSSGSPLPPPVFKSCDKNDPILLLLLTEFPPEVATAGEEEPMLNASKDISVPNPPKPASPPSDDVSDLPVDPPNKSNVEPPNIPDNFKLRIPGPNGKKGGAINLDLSGILSTIPGMGAGEGNGPNEMEFLNQLGGNVGSGGIFQNEQMISG